jgi:hypothetical protein
MLPNYCREGRKQEERAGMNPKTHPKNVFVTIGHNRSRKSDTHIILDFLRRVSEKMDK